MPRVTLRSLPPALFLLTYPSASLLIPGAGSALSIAAAIVALVLLALPQRWTDLSMRDWDRIDTAFCVCAALPVLAVLLAGVAHGQLVVSTLDSPSRFLLAAPVFLILRRSLPGTLAWADLSFALAALASLGILLFIPRDWGLGRISSKFLNPIHFGDIALAMGALSVLSLNWWRKDRAAVRLVKIAGLFAGLAASVITGTRGSWIAIPVVAVMVVYLRSRGKSRKWKVVLPLAMAALLAGVYVFSSTVRARFGSVSSDLVQYMHGHKDTAMGIRLQLYEAALRIVESHPLLGLGGDGFRDSMQAFADAGLITPIAAQFGRGEAHNQMLAYMTDYGGIGGLALLGIYLVPGIIFWRRLGAPALPAQRAALLGLTFVVSFWIFGLSVETFDLKLTVSFYSTLLAILVAGCTYADRRAPHSGTAQSSPRSNQ
ncbi:O-antigen ligase family protein [Paraburkholderia sp. MMS20-SJTR3]|uniref:O-antigen ligase family protein n=1 Tax=Paraburkholderia sejongensis TaxID=2886946 RepID=A0ABS8K278_9BURK|nr:O-antigen ligase family protein [Paraburkholderia sp. MMS20-SJTR3]MCC8396257.1 O-antigen ligase family protein [Paraburkholderia sp. MMS20-SJTR3]